MVISKLVFNSGEHIYDKNRTSKVVAQASFFV